MAGLLAEVARLVEYPVVLMGRLARISLVCTGGAANLHERALKKSFSVRNPKTGPHGTLLVTVANRTTADDGATILGGDTKKCCSRHVCRDPKFFLKTTCAIAPSMPGMQRHGWTACPNVTLPQ